VFSGGPVSFKGGEHGTDALVNRGTHSLTLRTQSENPAPLPPDSSTLFSALLPARTLPSWSYAMRAVLQIVRLCRARGREGRPARGTFASLIKALVRSAGLEGTWMSHRTATGTTGCFLSGAMLDL